MFDNMQELSEIAMHISEAIAQLENCRISTSNWAGANDIIARWWTHFTHGLSRTEGTAVKIEENTADNDFTIAILSGILSHHLRDLVTAGKNSNGLRCVTSLLI